MADTNDSREKRRAYNRAWAAANREKVRKRRRVWLATNRNERNAYERARRANDLWRTAYRGHKYGARKRGIAFLLTFEEWAAIWHESGKWEQRGIRGGQYVMARFGDAGPYAVDNVRICTKEENNSERWHIFRHR